MSRLPTPRPGEVLGLVGTNGIGKSTALKILAGKQKPNLGKFEVCCHIQYCCFIFRFTWIKVHIKGIVWYMASHQQSFLLLNQSKNHYHIQK